MSTASWKCDSCPEMCNCFCVQGGLQRAVSDVAAMLPLGAAAACGLRRASSAEAPPANARLTSRQRASLLARCTRAAEPSWASGAPDGPQDIEPVAAAEFSSPSKVGALQLPEQLPASQTAAAAVPFVSPFALVAQQAAMEVDDEADTPRAPGSPAKTALPPASPCFRTPAAAEVLVAHLAAAAAAPPDFRAARPQPQRRRSAPLPRTLAMPRQRSLKRAGSNKNAAAKRSHKRQLPPLPPSLLPPAELLPRHTAAAAAGAAAADGAWRHEAAQPAADACPAAWQQHAAGQQRQVVADTGMPSLWQMVTGLHFGGLHLPTAATAAAPQQAAPQQQQQQGQAQHEIQAWLEAATRGGHALAASQRQPAPQGSQEMQHQAQTAQNCSSSEQCWREQAVLWYGRPQHQALAAPDNFGSREEPGSMFTRGGQQASGQAVQQSAGAWAQLAAAGHSTAICVAQPTMQMVLQSAAQPQPPASIRNGWQAPHSAAMTSRNVAQTAGGAPGQAPVRGVAGAPMPASAPQAGNAYWAMTGGQLWPQWAAMPPPRS